MMTKTERRANPRATLRNAVYAALRTASPRARYLAEPPETLHDLMRLFVPGDYYTGRHSVRVANLSLAIAARTELTDTRSLMQVYTGALLHDVGKVTVPFEILNKPGRLTASERELIRTHAEHGETMLRNVLPEETVLSIVRSHHEHYDGTGYPDSLVGTAIPLGARIVAVADAYDAMLNGRPYREGTCPDVILQIMRSDDNRQWDGSIVAILADLIEDGFASPEATAMPQSNFGTPSASLLLKTL